MKVFISSAITAIVITVIAGVILLAIEYGMFTPKVVEVATAPAAQETPAPTLSPTPVPVVPAGTVGEPTAEDPTEAPIADNTIFTDYRIEVVGKKLSATEYGSSQPPGYYMKVFTAAGEVDNREGCYAHLELYNNGILLTTGDTKCGLQGGWSTSWWPNSTRLEDGTVTVTASITSDWGATAYTETSFAVRKG